MIKSFFRNAVCAAVAVGMVMLGRADWTYDSSSSTLTDGSNWSFGATWNAETGALKITGCKGGAGVLDLRDMTVGGVAVAELRFSSKVFDKNTAITEFYANNLCGTLARLFSEARSLTTISLAGEGLTGLLSEKGNNDDCGFAENCSSLVSVTLDCPNLTEIGSYAFRKCTELVAEFSSIVTPNVTRVGERAFENCGKMTGGIVLNVTDYIGPRAFEWAVGLTDVRFGKGAMTSLPNAKDSEDGIFERCMGLTNVVIEADSLEIGKYIFLHCSSLAHLEFVVPTAIALSAKQPFMDCPSLTEIVFAGEAPTATALDTILEAVSASGAEKSCTIFASVKQAGWTNLAAPLTEVEAAVAPVDCFGVYRDGSRKAWLVHCSSPFDPVESGTLTTCASPEGFGTPNMPYDTYENVASGTAFSVLPWYKTNGKLYRCVGYVLEALNGAEWTVVGRGGSCSWEYVPSEKMQRLTWQFEFAGGELNLQVADASSVAVTPEPIFDGCYTNGTPMTLVAHDFTEMPRADFICWYGANLPAGIDTAAKTIAFSFDDTLDFGARYRGYDWIYDAATRTMTDRNWKLGVKSFDPATGSLTIESCVLGRDVLDLRDLVVEGVAVAELKFTSQVFDKNLEITEFYANHLSGTLARTFAEAANLKVIDIAGEGLTALLSATDKNVFGFAEACSSLECVRLDCPNLTEIGNYAFSHCTSLTNSFSSIVKPFVTHVGVQAFYDCNKMTGGFEMRVTDYIGGRAFELDAGLTSVRFGKGAMTSLPNAPGSEDGIFERCTGLTNVVIEADALTIGKYIFHHCESLEHLEFVVPSAIVLSAKPPCTYCSALTEIVFAGEAPTATALDTILEAVSASDAEKSCTIFASKHQAGWKELAAPLTDDEKAVAPVGCFGVYRDANRKAWLVRRASPFDPHTGMMILVH